MRPMPAPDDDHSSSLLVLIFDSTLMGGLLAFLIAQLSKPVTNWYTTRKWDLQRAVSSGGMPSSHTALIVGVTSATGVQEGIGSSIFALCLVVTLIVSYDAAGVRRAAGKHAAVLNALLSELPVHHPAHVPLRSGEQLDAKLGHTPLQVFAGMGVGLVVGVLWQTLR